MNFHRSLHAPVREYNPSSLLLSYRSHCVSRGALYHMGTNVLCEDISGGREAVLIPCTNDIDADPAPIIQYITNNRFFFLESSLLYSIFCTCLFFFIFKCLGILVKQSVY